jgi:hypothetical protein
MEHLEEDRQVEASDLGQVGAQGGALQGRALPEAQDAGGAGA